MFNPIPVLEKLDEMTDAQKTMIYLKVFNNPEAEMVLTDLMDHFFEFKPTSNDHEAGSQAVIIYIKNRLLGIAEADPANSTGEQHESQS